MPAEMSPPGALTPIDLAVGAIFLHYSNRADFPTSSANAEKIENSSSLGDRLPIHDEDGSSTFASRTIVLSRSEKPTIPTPFRSEVVMDMDQAAALFTQWGNFLLIWIGFGTLVGLLAKLILPGKDPGGTLATLIIGVFGSIVGAALLFFATGIRVSPISAAGFAVALVATIILLVLYRILYGQKWTTGVTILKWRRTPTRRRATVLEE
jgi:uncharacterized membrane protein YeaQ/YmgE (transglycosylase-associated protein family)